MENILESVKKLLGIEKDYEFFDPDILMGINSALMTLNQLGVGPVEGFVCKKEDTWVDLIGPRTDIESIKIYTYLKAKLSFDPPQTSFLLESITTQLSEIEWRVAMQVEEKEVTNLV